MRRYDLPAQPQPLEQTTFLGALDLALLLGDDHAIGVLLELRTIALDLTERLEECECGAARLPDDPCLRCRRP